MSLFLQEILSSTFRISGFCYSVIRCRRQVSFNSVNRKNSTTHLHKSELSPKGDSPRGNPDVIQSIGQPTHLTHPHKMLEGEVVPGIRLEEFQFRRNKLIENIKIFASKSGFMKKSHLIVIPSSRKKFMTEAIPYIFRQNSDFLYLTGCMEPDSILAITSDGSEKQENILFLRGKNAQEELWDGPRTGIEEAVDFFGIDKCLPLSAFEFFITSFMKEYSETILWYNLMNDVHPNIHKCMAEFLTESANKTWKSPKPLIHQLRLYKSQAEQELMKKSCEIGSNAMKATIKNSKPWENESQIFAKMDYECRMNGAEYLAYPPVVAGGNRANIIHYINNDQVIRDGEMVLMDAGCEYRGYSSDITRTWPISGKFSPAQRILYEVVYAVHTELIQMCRESVSLNQLFNAMCRLIGMRLQEAGVISIKNFEDLSRAGHAFCPHDVSHYLGMDVHDTSCISRTIALEPGMVFTIEPGVYININNKLASPEFRGHGIRIEDDILMTSNGPVVLTSSCPKHPDDIENLSREEK